MSWAKFDDSYTENRKVRSVSAMAQHLHMFAIIHCAKGETDGFFPKYDLPLVASKARIKTPAGPMQELVDARLMHDHGDRYEVHDFLDYNPSHAELEAKRQEGAKRVSNWRRNGRRNKGGNGTCNGVTPPVTNSVANGVSNERPDPGTLSPGSDPSVLEADPDQSNPHAKPTGFDLLVKFGNLRREILKLQSAPGTETPRDPNGKASTFAESLTPGESRDVEATMRLALEHIRDGVEGWDDTRNRDPAFAFGAWRSGFPGLREQVHGLIPKPQKRTASGKPAPMQARY